MSGGDPTLLVSTDWLGERLNAPDIRILDASMYLPTDGRNGRELYAQAHIPGARLFDIDDVSDDHSPLPHMLPPVEKFVSRVRKMGIGDGHRIVVYDQQGIYSAARVWWMFRLFGHEDVAVLDGGLPKWQAEGRPVDDIDPDPRGQGGRAARGGRGLWVGERVGGWAHGSSQKRATLADR